jgi:hypothetical protein
MKLLIDVEEKRSSLEVEWPMDMKAGSSANESVLDRTLFMVQPDVFMDIRSIVCDICQRNQFTNYCQRNEREMKASWTSPTKVELDLKQGLLPSQTLARTEEAVECLSSSVPMEGDARCKPSDTKVGTIEAHHLEDSNDAKILCGMNHGEMVVQKK